MTRTEVNQYIAYAMDFMATHHFYLPEWAFWSPAQWNENKEKCTEIATTGMGWDITDFGSEDFLKTGLTLVTLRNGKLNTPSKPYCEKIMLVRKNQVTPHHYHVLKTEDIINRGGGILCMKLWNSNAQGELVEGDLTVSVDGISTVIKSGSLFTLRPGQSICYTPGLYHTFWAEEDDCLVGEVSSVNDDKTDNYFLLKQGRFSRIVEDEAIAHYLCNEYPF